jgi:hypothetical protein
VASRTWIGSYWAFGFVMVVLSFWKYDSRLDSIFSKVALMLYLRALNALMVLDSLNWTILRRA